MILRSLYLRIRRLLQSTGPVAGALHIGMGSGAGQALLLAITPLLTRLYSPDSFGVLAVYASSLGILLAVSTLRWDFAIPLPDAASIAWDLTVLAIVSIFLLCGIGAGLVLPFGEPILDRLGLSYFVPYLWLLPLGLAIGGLFRIGNYWSVRLKSFKPLGQSKFVQSLGRSIGQISLGLIGFGAIGLIIGDIIGRLASCSRLAPVVLSQTRDSKISLRSLGDTASRYRDFPLVSSWGSLLNSAGFEAPPLLVGSLFGANSAGLFILAYKVVAAPTGLVGRAVAKVYMSQLSESNDSDFESPQHLLIKTSLATFLISLVPAATIFLAGVPLFRIIFGPEWASAGSYIKPLCLVLVTQMTVNPISQTLNIVERQRLQAAWESIRLLAVTLSFLVPASLGHSPDQAILYFSITTSVCYISLWALCYSVLKNHSSEITPRAS